MDPITINKLLNISNDLLLVNENKSISDRQFSRVIQVNYKSKNLERRVRDVYRVLNEMKFISSNEQGFNLSTNYFDFIEAWNEGNLLTMNRCLTEYQPYKTFQIVLKHEKSIKIPKNKAEKQYLTNFLKGRYTLNAVSFDTFRYWSAALGQSYKSPFDDYLIWAGDWDDSNPEIGYFRSVLLTEFKRSKKDAGFVNTGILADKVCKYLNISFQAFENKLNDVINLPEKSFIFASITSRLDHEKSSEIITIRKRQVVLANQKVNAENSQEWFEYRNLLDGVRINGKLRRLVRQI